MIDIQIALELELQGHRKTLTLQLLYKQSVSQCQAFRCQICRIERPKSNQPHCQKSVSHRCANSTQTPAPYEPNLMCLQKQWRVAQNLKNGIWYRWIRKYFPELTRRTKWCLSTQSIHIGRLVFICDPDMPRSQMKKRQSGRDIHRTTWTGPLSQCQLKPLPGQFTGVGMSVMATVKQATA
ncbi:hypothetical protein EVAR_71148_1 [Eumeta japonica]|uniref:DUF5641 domain-containing protein n=1 Tax=Eumeta variegata TaxID=151549 RepID=A0A4C1SUK3_EUMVA|nr:hypothetical protein EVAR_71148_1 [Eumeta japonica]